MSADWIGRQMRLIHVERANSDRMLIVKAEFECKQGDKEPGRYKVTAFNEMADKLERYPIGAIVDLMCYTRTRDVETNGKTWTAEDKILTMISELKTQPSQMAQSYQQPVNHGYQQPPAQGRQNQYNPPRTPADFGGGYR